MSPSGWRGYWEEHVGRLVWGVVAVWTILVGASLLWDIHQARKAALELARTEAQLSYEKDLAYRLWSARHGGVYVPVSPQSPPNPYLAQVAERDILTPAGRALTLVNPAYMTRQVHELAAQLYGTRGHLTSLKPLRPENAPDAWEAKALESFEAGEAESIEVVSMAGQPYMRLMRPWRTEQACLKCHAAQGYKVGDIRGGISVAVPLQPYVAGIRAQTLAEAASHGLIWLLGVAGIFVGDRRLQKHLQERRQAEAELAETLRQKEEALALLDAIFDSAPIGLGFWDRDLRFVRLNQALADINGYAIQEHLGRRVDEMSLGLEDPQGLMDSWRQILETGEPRLNVEVSGSLAAHPAERRTWMDNWFPVRRGDEIIGLAATVTDITARQRSEAEIKRLASFPQLNPNPVLEIDANNSITYANQAALEALKQLSPEAGLRDFLPRDWEEIQQVTRETGARNFEREVRIKDTVFSEVIAFAEPFNVWRLYANDISKRQQAEAALRRAHEELEERVRQRTEELRQQTILLEGINRVLREALTCETAEELSRIVLTVAAEVTGARFGFIAEISSEDRLNILASSDPGWTTGRIGETGDWAQPQHLEIRGLYRSVIQQGQTLMANDPDSHPDSLGVPAGHPPLTSFLGVPLWRGEQVVGLIGLGNKAGGFEEADQKAVETLAVAGSEALSRLRAETKAASIGRLYRLLSRVNETIVRAADRESLFDQTCRIAVEEGGFRLAWIGLLDQENQLIKPTAQYGFEQGYLEHLVISVADVPESRGPTGVAVREGKYDVCNNFATDLRMAPWRQRALERGYRSSAAFPLRVGAQVVGAMTLYADRAGFFTEAEIGLVGSLAQDLSFALESLDREAKRRTAEEEIRRLNAGLEERVQERTAELARAVENLGKEMVGRVKAEEALQRAIADLQIVNQELQAEIVERQTVQDKLQISLRFLEVVHQNTEINSLLEAFVAEIKAYTGCEAVGIRVLNTQAGIPYLAYQGFSQEFYELENPLNIQTDQCMCINVIKGTTDSNLPFYTPGGSFYLNGTTRFLATVSTEGKGSTRNMCNQVGYESVALIPFRRGEQILGLIHVADKAENMVPLEMVEILEKAGMQLGSAFQRLQAEAARRESEAKFRSLFDNMTEGVALHEMIFDRDGRAVDYRILAVNPAFEKHTGLSSVQLQGQPASQVYDSSEAPYLEIYAQVARSGQADSFETFFPPLQRHFHISATSPKQGHFVTVFEDITARKEMEEALYRRTTELSRVVTDLEQKNAEMERFTYMISHDLKSPLVTISTFLGYLKKDMASADTGRVEKDMQYMRGAAEKMGRLLAELLEMSRIGRVVNQPVKVTFQELVEEALNAVAGPLLGRGLEVQVSDSEVTLCGDRPRLVEIWQNLVENAVKFMGEQSAPRLEIGFQRQGDDVVFFVCDNGIGVDPRYQSKIFGIFEKLNSSIDGTGIGLAFVKRIVELYNGTMWVESAGLGQGACFRFTLPGAVKTE